MDYIILDFGKVLAYPTTGHWFITPKFKELVDNIDINKVNKIIKDNASILDSRALTLEQEYLMFLKFYTTIFKDMNLDVDLNIIRQIAYNFVYESDKYKMYPSVVDELKTLKENYKLICLTDNWPCVIPIMKQYQIYEYFEYIYISSIYKLKKEDKIFFEYPIKDFNLDPKNTIFVDDTPKLLDIAATYNLKPYLMDREHNVSNSKYPIIDNLYCLSKKR